LIGDLALSERKIVNARSPFYASQLPHVQYKNAVKFTHFIGIIAKTLIKNNIAYYDRPMSLTV